jgi:hypothetical protein
VPPGFATTALTVAPLTGDATRESVLASASFSPGASSPLRRHPGDCVGTVVEGTVDDSRHGIRCARKATPRFRGRALQSEASG